ncbi:MAG: DUF1622 domain-containing protein [Gemmatimonadota bacterium]
MELDTLLTGLARGIEIAAILVLLAGVVLSSGAFLRDWLTDNLTEAYHRYRANLGRAILLGIEFLVVGDIIGTVAVNPTMESLSVLGTIVVIRTFLSLALEIEISGRLPWHRDAGSAPHEP